MSANISESGFEKIFTDYLVNNNDFKYKNYTATKDYSPKDCIDVNDMFGFIADTQPLELAKLQRNYGDDHQKKFLERLQKEINDKGIIEVLRKGVNDRDCKIKLMFFEPNSDLNPELIGLWNLNRFVVTRQLHYSTSNNNSLDMVILINGLPIITFELKNLLTGQSVRDAIKQYKYDRSSKEKLFSFGRCSVHFAMDTELVYMTTQLKDDKTRFLPFNKGYNNGAGNPPLVSGIRTGYMWEEILTKSSIGRIIENFAQIVTEQKKDKTIKKLIFPRYHQLDVVKKLLNSSKRSGTGQKYLIQHSAGSGKSNSIAWLAHQLSGLYGADGITNVFDSIIVLTDRIALDNQLGQTVKSFEKTKDLIAQVNSGQELKESLQNGKRIIISTIQKFPVIANSMEDLSGTKFAIIIDEAHSSTGGETMTKVNQTIQDTDSEEEKTDEDIVIETLQNRRMLKNASYFAFTATPKNKTLELFGLPNDQGQYSAFHVYSMKQAIEEGFILDVLANYTTYNSYYGLIVNQNHDKEYGVRKANTQIKKFIESDSFTLQKKAEIMLEHFYNHVYKKGLVGGHARAMLVSSSRLIAAKYHFIFKQIIKDRNYNFQVITAFSGDVDLHGTLWNEGRINNFKSSEIPTRFEEDNYQILICANKFQTGFDQPLLQTMYVDKKLGGVNAVQTLSRLNRCHVDKESTFVLDFCNTEDEIKASFEPYYKTTMLSHGSDPNKLHDLKSILDNFNVYTNYLVKDFTSKLLKNEKIDLLHSILDTVSNKIKLLSSDEIDLFKKTSLTYTRFYSFISQIINFDVPEFEELYQFLKLLNKKIIELGPLEEILSQDVLDSINFESYRNQKILSNGRIYLDEESQLSPIPGSNSTKKSEDIKEQLANNVNDFNLRFGTDFGTNDKVLNVYITEMADKIIADKTYAFPDKENRQLVLKKSMDEKTTSLAEQSMEFYNIYHELPGVKEYLADMIEKEVKKRLRKEL